MNDHSFSRVGVFLYAKARFYVRMKAVYIMSLRSKAGMKGVLPSIRRKRRIPTLNITQIKYVAAALTVCLLFHTLFAPMVDVPEWFIAVGRPALPLFLFAAAEGYVHTRSRQTYLKRLLPFRNSFPIATNCHLWEMLSVRCLSLSCTWSVGID